MECYGLQEILNRHQHWLKQDCCEWEEMRADFLREDFEFTTLDNVSLPKSHFYKANFTRSSFHHSDLSESFISDSFFTNADLYEANLRGATLLNVDLRHACLVGADLSHARISSNTDFRGANLARAKLEGIDVDTLIPQCCPSNGEFIAWKKAFYIKDWDLISVIVKLLIPEDARRSSATGRKCRASKAVCLAIENVDGSPSPYPRAHSTYDSSFVYEVGKMCTVDNFCEDRFNECAPGIHFFITRQEAVNY